MLDDAPETATPVNFGIIKMLGFKFGRFLDVNMSFAQNRRFFD
jgi:hypothetical protein